jgi:hypothetical protein
LHEIGILPLVIQLPKEKGVKTITIVLATILVFATVGCGSTKQDEPEYISYKQLLSNNRLNLLKLKEGMSRDEVMATMGTTPSMTGNGAVPNPFVIDHREYDEVKYEVMYYLVRKYPPFTRIKKSQATQIVIKDGKLAAWGDGAINRARR